MSLKTRLGRLETHPRQMTDEQLEQALQSFRRRNPEGYAYLTALEDDELERLMSKRGVAHG